MHKSDAGGVRLGLGGTDPVRAAAGEIERSVARAGHRLDCLVVQPMAPAGVELIVGVVHDDSFRPVLACGAGGTTAELIGDVAVRIMPVTDVEAREMVRSLETFPPGGRERCKRRLRGGRHRVGSVTCRFVGAHPQIWRH